LHLLRVGERHVLGAVRDRSLLPVAIQQQDAGHQYCEKDCYQRSSDDETYDCFSSMGHLVVIIPVGTFDRVREIADWLRSRRTSFAIGR
jgi:hypothetical protein